MTARPLNDAVHRLPRAVAATLMARRLPTAPGRNRSAWRTWRRAGFSEALEPLSLPVTARASDSNSRLRLRGLATWETASHAGRLVTFNLAVVIIHIAVLWWIFLRIGA